MRVLYLKVGWGASGSQTWSHAHPLHPSSKRTKEVGPSTGFQLPVASIMRFTGKGLWLLCLGRAVHHTLPPGAQCPGCPGDWHSWGRPVAQRQKRVSPSLSVMMDLVRMQPRYGERFNTAGSWITAHVQILPLSLTASWLWISYITVPWLFWRVFEAISWVNTSE